MPTVTDVSALNGLYKTVYPNEMLNKLIPATKKFTGMVPFKSDIKLGKVYEQPAVLAYEQGFTYSAPAQGAFSLKGAVPMNTQPASLDGYQIVERMQMDYETAAKAANGNSPQAFAKATGLQMKNGIDSFTKRLELACLYGRSGIGVGDSSTNVSTTRTTVLLLTSSWATGIWAGMKGAQLQFWKTSDDSLVSSGDDSIFSVYSVDVLNRKITVTGTTTGISALDTALGSTDCNIYFSTSRNSAGTAQEMIGLDKIITTSGSLFGIDNTLYELWKGNTYDVGSANLTFGKILEGIALPTGLGLNGKANVMVNNRSFTKLSTNEAALRKYDASYDKSKAQNGFEKITFYGENGPIEIHPYNCIKEGDAFAFPDDTLVRIGACDISPYIPGTNDGDIFFHLTDYAGFEHRLYTDQSLFCEAPAKCLKFTNIVNS